MERDLVHPCEVCDGVIHVRDGAPTGYRAVVVASERVTDTEDWTALPESTLFHIDGEQRLSLQPL